MAAIVGISSGRSPRTAVHHRNQPIKSKPALYKPLLHFHSNLKTAVHKQQGGVLQSQRWVWHVLTHTYQGIQKRSWLGPQINISGLLVTCDWIWEDAHSRPHPILLIWISLKPQGMVYRLQTFKDDKGIVVLQSLKISHVSIIPN